jgi:hypothetical protein
MKDGDAFDVDDDDFDLVVMLKELVWRKQTNNNVSMMERSTIRSEIFVDDVLLRRSDCATREETNATRKYEVLDEATTGLSDEVDLSR